MNRVHHHEIIFIERRGGSPFIVVYDNEKGIKSGRNDGDWAGGRLGKKRGWEGMGGGG